MKARKSLKAWSLGGATAVLVVLVFGSTASAAKKSGAPPKESAPAKAAAPAKPAAAVGKVGGAAGAAGHPGAATHTSGITTHGGSGATTHGGGITTHGGGMTTHSGVGGPHGVSPAAHGIPARPGGMAHPGGLAHTPNGSRMVPGRNGDEVRMRSNGRPGDVHVAGRWNGYPPWAKRRSPGDGGTPRRLARFCRARRPRICGASVSLRWTGLRSSLVLLSRALVRSVLRTLLLSRCLR